MEETIIETFDDVKFIQGATKMNQTNWQNYFGTMLPNGIYEGLLVQDYYGLNENGYPITMWDYPNIITDGSVFVNGLLAQIRTEDGYTEIGNTTANTDRFICVRVYLKEEKAQIVQKTGIAEYDSTRVNYNINTLHELDKFVFDETYCCDRNEYYWDIPIFYQVPYDLTTPYILSDGRSLRRTVNLNRTPVHNPDLRYTGTRQSRNIDRDGVYLVSDNNTYSGGVANAQGQYVDETGQHDLYQAYVYMDNINPPNNAIITLHNGWSGAPSDSVTMINFCHGPYANTIFRVGSNFSESYGAESAYDYDTSDPNFSYYARYRLPLGENRTFRITSLNWLSRGGAGVYDDPLYFTHRTYLIEVIR